MLPSMGEVGNSYENAFAESSIKTIKYDEVHMKEYESFEEAHTNIKKFIEEVYNKKRLLLFDKKISIMGEQVAAEIFDKPLKIN